MDRMFVALSRIVPVCTLGLVAFAGWSLFYPSISNSAPTVVVSSLTAGVQATAQPEEWYNPNHVEGHYQCVDCHKTEYAAWKVSTHGWGTDKKISAYERLRIEKKSLEYAKELDIAPSDIAQNSICVKCHGSTRVDDQGREIVMNSITCEACHGPSGGEQGWLNAHAVYGPQGSRRETETPEHFAYRTDRVARAGQRRSADMYSVIRTCFDCHVEGDEELVNTGGHNNGDRFVYSIYALGEVRHNFHMDQTKNAEVSSIWLHPQFAAGGRTAAGRHRVMLILAQLADMDAALTKMMRVTDVDGDYYEMLADRFIAAYEYLFEDIVEILEDDDIESPLIEEAAELLEPVYEILDDEDYDPEDEDQAAELKAVLKKLNALGIRFGKEHDGSKLAAEGLDEIVSEIEPRGDVYEP